MSPRTTTLRKLFRIESGDFHAIKELDNGRIPLISCGELDNGFIGYYDIPVSKRYKNKITVAYNGQPLTAKYHPYEFGAKDDVGVLIPKEDMSESLQLLIAAQLNIAKWRYSYGRKCFKQKLEGFEIIFPEKRLVEELQLGDGVKAANWQSIIPKRTGDKNKIPSLTWQQVRVSDFFDLRRGDFHSISNLNVGEYATVSRVTINNGVVGKYEKPKGAVVYPAGTITVSTLGGDAFVQLVDFIATDNVIVCVPKTKLARETIYFVASMINQQKWRYSYGRQPYKAKLEMTKIYLPVAGRVIDEDTIKKVIDNSGYWYLVDKRLSVSPNP